MHKQTSNTAQQSGFTLIELIVVIVILGILAAVALPKFADLGKDARIASLNAASGSIESAAAMVHGKFLTTNPVPTSVTFEGTAIPIANGYPTAVQALATAAGLKAIDYTVIPASSAATANSPATSPTEIAIIPISVAGSPSGLTCYTKYTAPVSAITAPTMVRVTTGC